MTTIQFKYVQRLHNLFLQYSTLDEPSDWLALTINNVYDEALPYFDNFKFTTKEYYREIKPNTEEEKAAKHLLLAYITSQDMGLGRKFL